MSSIHAGCARHIRESDVNVARSCRAPRPATRDVTFRLLCILNQLWQTPPNTFLAGISAIMWYVPSKLWELLTDLQHLSCNQPPCSGSRDTDCSLLLCPYPSRKKDLSTTCLKTSSSDQWRQIIKPHECWNKIHIAELVKGCLKKKCAQMKFVNVVPLLLMLLGHLYSHRFHGRLPSSFIRAAHAHSAGAWWVKCSGMQRNRSMLLSAGLCLHDLTAYLFTNGPVLNDAALFSNIVFEKSIAYRFFTIPDSSVKSLNSQRIVPNGMQIKCFQVYIISCWTTWTAVTLPWRGLLWTTLTPDARRPVCRLIIQALYESRLDVVWKSG
jgi:hypothetical protein